MSSEQRPRIVMDVCRDGWTGGLQLGIAALDENDHGDGYRIAGPKYNGSQEALLSRDLDERDAREIRGYLDRAFPIGDEEAEQQASVRQYGQGLAPMSPERLAEIRVELAHTETQIDETAGWELGHYRAVKQRLHETRLLLAEVERLRAELAAHVQCDDCGAIGDVSVGTDGLRHLAPSGQCAYPVVSLASLTARHDESGGEGRG